MELPQAIVKYSRPSEADGLYDLRQLMQNGDPWQNQGQSIRNYMLQLYSLTQVTALWKPDMARYDYVLYMRPDVVFKTKLDLPKIAPRYMSPERQANLSAMYIATPRFAQFYGLNDRFAYGPPQVMVKYGERMSQLWQYVLVLHRRPHAEKFLRYVVKLNNWRVVYTNVCFERLRTNGELWPDCSVPLTWFWIETNRRNNTNFELPKFVPDDEAGDGGGRDDEGEGGDEGEGKGEGEGEGEGTAVVLAAAAAQGRHLRGADDEQRGNAWPWRQQSGGIGGGQRR